ADGHLTSTAMSGGIIMCPSDIGAAARYMRELCRVNGSVAWTDDGVIEAWARSMSQNKAWVEKTLGSSVVPFGNAAWARLPGWESMTTYHYRGWGVGLMNAFLKQVQARKIGVTYQSRAKRLLTDSKGNIVGLNAEVGLPGESRDLNIRASKAVVLTCGGFEYDEAMKLQYLKMYPYYSHGTPANTGDGVRMAMDVGADLWHMNCCSGRLMAQFPDFPIAFSIDFGGKGSTARDAGHEGSFPQGKMQVGYIVVDKHGRSYASGKGRPHQQAYELALFDSYRLEHPRLPSYYIFDQARIDDGPLPYLHAGASGPCGAYKWSRDNSAEIEKGWIIRAETVAELAKKIKIDPDSLVQTVRAHNERCGQGGDTLGGKSGDLFPLSNPPYYAVELWPGGFTHGGARRNGKAQILNVDGVPIKGLYGAGEFGSVNGMVDASSGSLVGECIAFGRLAGDNAAAEKR
ncbi:MAG: FAD-binding protein, partial [Dehalococcoidia bacterium]|nr:FAD-binding protein [Dehalococcoidia bacterium]